MTAPAARIGPGPVDRLASYFLSKFQEAKKGSDVASLQCSTRLKFEAMEGMLNEHTQRFSAVREEMQSFWDKAPSYFLHQFSVQLDTVSASRNEKTELALARQQQRFEDETKNLNEQLSDLSAKLAVCTAKLNARVDEVGQKISEAHEVTTKNVQRCENEFRSRISRLESLLEANKADAELERDKSRSLLQDTTKRLQGKMDNLERTVMRQSEQLADQEEKISRLEESIRNEIQMRIRSEKSCTDVFKVLSANIRELAQAQVPLAPTSPATTLLGSSNETGSEAPRQIPRRPRASPRLATSKTSVAMRHTSSALTHPPSSPSPRTQSHIPRPESASNGISRTIACKRNGDLNLEPLPKRQRTSAANNDRPTEIGSTDLKQPTEPVLPESTALRPIRHANGQKGPRDNTTLQKSSEMNTIINERHENTIYDAIKAQKPPPVHNEERQQVPVVKTSLLPPTRKRKCGHIDTEKPERARTNSENENKTRPVQNRERDVVNSHPRDATDQPRTASSSPGKDATRAFVTHVKLFAKRYNEERPRSERLFIWKFLDEIPDPVWATYMQAQLLEAYPESVRPSLGKRAKHAINFNAGLTWRCVVHLIRAMQQKTVPAHLGER